MKKSFSFYVITVISIVIFASCSSTPKVSRVDASTQTDLTGRWNDSDVRIVSESLINDLLSAPSVINFIQQYSAQNGGRLPAVIVGDFRNTSSDRINTGIISTSMETAIVNSGRLDFVAGGDLRQQIRDERQDQLENVSDETAVGIGRETGAILMLTGTVNSIVEQAGNTTVRAYFVNAQLTDIETGRRIWMGENNEIKKVMQRSRTRL